MTKRRLLAALTVVAVSAGWVAVEFRGTGGGMTQQAQKFLASLSDEQQTQATMPYADERRVQWHFIPKQSRKGLQLGKMNEAQRKAAHALLRSALSEAGYDKSVTVMQLEDILYVQQGRKHKPWRRDPLLYYFTVFGTPDTKGKWALSIEGHHLSLNFVVEDGQVTSHTPAFFGANPAIVKKSYGAGPKKGTRTLAQEEVLAFKLLGSLSKDQQALAVRADKAPKDIRAAAEPRPPQSAAVGLPASRMSAEQQKTLMSLVKTYTDNMPRPRAEAQLAEINDAGVDNIHFAWEGARQEGVGHYYRIQGPTFVIEFCNVQPDGEGNPANHIHAVFRSLKGDFGIEL